MRTFRGVLLASALIAVSLVPGARPAPAAGACDIPVGAVLRTDASGSDVLCLEHALESRGLLAPRVVDGRFRSATTTAVKRLQRRSGLPRTGVARRAEFEALGVRRPILTNASLTGRQHPGHPDVVVIGDSITAQSAAQQLAALEAAGYDAPVIDGGLGRSIFDAGDSAESGLEVIERTAERFQGGAGPALWVIALGTNDAGNSSFDTLGSYEMRIRMVLAAIPPSAGVLWVEPAVQSQSLVHGREDELAAFNRALERVAADTPRLGTLPWDAYAAWPGVLGSDGVHLTEPVGVAVRVDAVTQAVTAAVPA